MLRGTWNKYISAIREWCRKTSNR